MVFSSIEFFIFFALVLFTYWPVLGLFEELRARKLRHIFLLIGSYYFYMSWNVQLAGLILFSTLIDYFVGHYLSIATNESRRKSLLVVSMVTNLGLLAIFKYCNFFLDNLEWFFELLGRDVKFELSIILPVGISFYTFQSMSYTIDIYRRKIKPTYNFVQFALFVSFFPQLVAGPIVRASCFLPQLKESVKFSNVRLQRAIYFIVLGLAKKVVVADWMGIVADPVFSNPDAFSGTAIWAGVIAYTIQIYCDFSGYSDIAIGAAGLLGYELPINFNMPYLATSVKNFWKRWHISLSSWLQDYLYISLGGSRGSKLFTYRNLMLTMLLGGLWHGASWNFVVWGALHGFALVVHREFSLIFEEKRFLDTRAWQFFSWFITLTFVCFTWVVFRAKDFPTAWTMFKKMLFFDGSGFGEFNYALLGIMLLAVFISHLIASSFKSLDKLLDNLSKSRLLEAAGYAAILFIVIVFGQDEAQPFIYFQF